MAKARHGDSKGIALVILGIVAVIAIVGLVLLFTNAKDATGEVVSPGSKVYGGAIKNVEYPYWEGRGVPMGAREEEFRSLDYAQATTNWNYYGQPKRAPYELGDVPSPITSCGRNAILVSYGESNLQGWYESQGATCIPTDGSKAGVCCYFPDGMLTGIANTGGVNLGRTPYTYG